MMLANNVLTDFMFKLDSNISSTNLNEAIMKAKMIEIEQKNASGAIQVNTKMMQLEIENQMLQQ